MSDQKSSDVIRTAVVCVIDVVVLVVTFLILKNMIMTSSDPDAARWTSIGIFLAVSAVLVFFSRKFIPLRVKDSGPIVRRKR